MIIDAHMHLGNFLYPNGGEIIDKHIKMPNPFNIQRFEEDILKFKSFGMTKKFFDTHDDDYTVSVQNRIFAATAENLAKHVQALKRMSLLRFGDEKVFCMCMPIEPYVSLKDISATDLKEYIKPFTSIYPTNNISYACDKLESEMESCFGLKLHPIIQGIRFDSELTYAALSTLAKFNKPVLFHAGASRYYIGNEKYKQHCEYDNISSAQKMVSSFPSIPFIIGHAGIAEYKEWADAFKSFENVFVDITVQSIPAIRNIVNLYGEDRIMYASDWPCVRTEPTIRIISKALNNSQLDKCLYKNANTIFNLV